MGFFSLVLANIFGRITRSLLTISGMAVAICAVVALVGIARGFQQSLREIYESRGIDLLVLQAGKVQQTSSVLPMSLIDDIQRMEGVEEATAVLSDVVSLDNTDLVAVPIQGWSEDSFLLQGMNVVQGRLITDADAVPSGGSEGGILLGESLAGAIEKTVGDKVEVLEGSPFEVVGIFQSFNVFEAGSIVMPLEALQKLMLREGEVTAVAVMGTDHSEAAISKLEKRIEAIGPSIAANATKEFAENTPEMKMTESIAWLTSSIALIVGTIGMLNTMLMAVFERTKEIAMLRAIGWRRSRIVTMILGESVVLAMVGATIGCLAALGLCRWLAQLPAANGMISGHIGWIVVVQGMVLAVIVGVLGGLYPGWRAARLLPVEGLRHD